MVLLVPVLFGIQALCSWAASSPARKAVTALLSPNCDDTAVEEAADLALRQINAHRKEGYILRPSRIFNVREQPQENTGSVFYLILDVVDTECHVLSRKLWKDCPDRTAHSTVYGQCKAVIYINQARNITHLNNYECTLQPVPARYIWSMCPDCPVDDCPTEPRYLEAAAQSLAKFNEESEQTHFFSLLNVTRASMQWVVGPAYFVEFLIQETSCSKTDTIDDISKCKPLSSELPQIGFCEGSVVNSHMEQKQSVTVSCEIYGRQDPAAKEQTPGTLSQNHQQASPSETNPSSPHLEKTVGWVKILPPATEDSSSQNPLEHQNEHKDGKPVPPEAVGSMHSLDTEKTQADEPDLTKPASGAVILPFPEEFSLSDSCPGEAKKLSPILQPLLPKKPTKV
ncbi:PREDICTED: fetuin-B [Buceros rhinoceros silvestris]|uniref:fetuin-B n=1 Tax=Buceros rhinoceros silvestris TaxID=175836 RepID=UPI0005284863|nr:PREDICTED: fetuin-B [Buceros rhinoceros silvestris]